jgi:general secretion pathway protein G
VEISNWRLAVGDWRSVIGYWRLAFGQWLIANCRPLTANRQPHAAGFTLIELLVVLAIVSTLLLLAVPRYFSSVDKAKEAVLKENLFQMRDAIGKYYSDKGKYPQTIEALAVDKYLRKIPVDPITDSSSTWVPMAPDDPQKGGVIDVKSGATGQAIDGTAYGEW